MALPFPAVYPAFLENFWLARAGIPLGGASGVDALERFDPAVRRLSDIFTVERPVRGVFPDYFSDSTLLAAYGLFFFPQSFERARLALDQSIHFRGWRPEARPAGHPTRILDIGSGAGACGLALASALNTPVALTALDRSHSALAALREIVAAAPESANILSLETRVADLRSSGALSSLPPQDIVIAGFAANEFLGGASDCPRANALRDWLAALRPALACGGLLLVLEPALRETARALQCAAHALVANGVFHLWAPDIGLIPADDADVNGDFCDHEVRRWTPPESLQFLNRRLFRETGVLKFAYAALGTSPPAPLPATPIPLRLVSPVKPLKGRAICAVRGLDNRRISLEITARNLSKHDIKAVAFAWERGDILGATPDACHSVGTGNALFRVAVDALTPLYQARRKPVSCDGGI
ncbi:MAG: hypothetical protein LBS59_01900 [Puniceicoccales bacterium]|jgi:SAM-dependent methyltransferase|nr:hypothetical protein [Puniceicoccales bacterium]